MVEQYADEQKMHCLVMSAYAPLSSLLAQG